MVTLGVGGGFTSLAKTFGGALGGVFTGIQSAFSFVGSALGSLFQGVSGVLSGITDFATNVFSGFGDAAAKVAQTVVTTGLSYGVSFGLEALGVDPKIAGFFGGLAAGAFVGANSQLPTTEATITNSITKETANITVAALTRDQFMQSTLMSSLAISQVGNIGIDLGFDPEFNSIIGLGLGAITGTSITNPNATYGEIIGKVAPQLSSSLASYGVGYLGESLGLDSSYTSLLRSGISYGLNAGLDNNGATSIIDGVNQGLLQGAATVGYTYAVEATGVDPLIGALSARVITGAISGLFQLEQDNPNFDPSIAEDEVANPRYLQPSNLFEGSFNALMESTMNVLTLGGPRSDTAYAQAQYLQGIKTFAENIDEKGFGVTMEEYATTVFARDTVEDLLRQIPKLATITGSAINSIGDFFTYLLNGGFASNLVDPLDGYSISQHIDEQGRDITRLTVKNGDSVDYVMQGDKRVIVGRQIGSRVDKGSFLCTESEGCKLESGTSSNGIPGHDGWTESLTVEGGLLKQLNITDENGQVILNAVPIAGETHIQHSNGGIDRGIVRSDSTNTVYQFENSMVTTIQSSDDSGNIIMSQSYGNGDKIEIRYGVNEDGVPYSPDMYNAQAIFGAKALQYGPSAKLEIVKNSDGIFEIVFGDANTKLRHQVSDVVGSLLEKAEQLSLAIDDIQDEQLYEVVVELAEVYTNVQTMAIGFEMIGAGLALEAPSMGSSTVMVVAGSGAVMKASLGLKKNFDVLSDVLDAAELNQDEEDVDSAFENSKAVLSFADDILEINISGISSHPAGIIGYANGSLDMLKLSLDGGVIPALTKAKVILDEK